MSVQCDTSRAECTVSDRTVFHSTWRFFRNCAWGLHDHTRSEQNARLRLQMNTPVRDRMHIHDCNIRCTSSRKYFYIEQHAHFRMQVGTLREKNALCQIEQCFIPPGVFCFVFRICKHNACERMTHVSSNMHMFDYTLAQFERRMHCVRSNSVPSNLAFFRF